MTSSEGGCLMNRPFKGGFEVTSRIFGANYYHVLVPRTNIDHVLCIRFFHLFHILREITYFHLSAAGFEPTIYGMSILISISVLRNSATTALFSFVLLFQTNCMFRLNRNHCCNDKNSKIFSNVI